MQHGGRGMLKRQLQVPPGVPAEGDGSNVEDWTEKFLGLFPPEALGKELELQEGKRSWWLTGVQRYLCQLCQCLACFRGGGEELCPLPVHAALRAPSLSWPAAKPAMPMLTGITENTKCLIPVWGTRSVSYNTSLGYS